MKFKAFVATYSPQNGEMTNKHNYFMNGLIKEDLGETDCADVCDISGMRNLYALTDGSNSSARGEDAAFLCVEMMQNIVGANFIRESEEYFASANDIVKGQTFENSGISPAVDMAAVYIYRNFATVYNIGDVGAFHFHKGEIKKLSGKMPDSIEVEELVNNDGKLELAKVSKKTAPHIGYLSDECQVVPHISGRTKIKKGDYIALISRDLLGLLTEKEIAAVLSDKKIMAEEKAIEIVNRACDKKADGNYTVQLIYAAGRSVIKGLLTALKIIAAALIIAVTIFFASPYIVSTSKAVANAFVFVVDFLTGDSKDEGAIIENVEPWVPIQDEVEEEEPTPETETSEETEGNEKTEEAAKPEPTTPAKAPSKPKNKPSVSTPKPTPAKTEETRVQPPSAEESTSKPAVNEPEPPAPPQVDNRDVELPIDFN